jgi:hypothetical protein
MRKARTPAVLIGSIRSKIDIGTIHQTLLIFSAVTVAFFSSTIYAQSEPPPCKSPSCKAEIAAKEKDQTANKYGIDEVDIAIKKIGDDEAGIKSKGAALKRDVSEYKIECTHIVVDTPAQQQALQAPCEQRRKALQDRADAQEKDEATLPALSQKLLDATSRKKKLQDDANTLERNSLVLYSRAIGSALRDLRAKKIAGDACKSITDTEAMHCCDSVIWGKVNPAQCDAKLLYTAFTNAGVFSVPAVVPRSR